MSKGIPYVDLELLEYLEETFPDRSPSLDDQEREIWFRAGKADLVKHLRILHDQQNAEGLAAFPQVG